MAEVTLNGTTRFNVIGNRRQQLYNVTGGTGNTLTTGLNNIIQVNIEDVATNPPTVTHTGGVVTFTSGGTFTTGVEVIGN
jgi:phage tail sheath gpL-like